jgi:hypothetical protein
LLVHFTCFTGVFCVVRAVSAAFDLRAVKGKSKSSASMSALGEDVDIPLHSEDTEPAARMLTTPLSLLLIFLPLPAL